MTEVDEQDLEDAQLVPDENEEDVLKDADKHMKNILKAAKWFSNQSWSTNEWNMYLESYAKKLDRDEVSFLATICDLLINKTPVGTPTQALLTEAPVAE